MKHSQNIEMLSIVAKGLGDLKEKVVFLGGATVGLHLTSPEAPEERPTDDVDCVVEITSLANYYKLGGQLKELGFREAVGEGHPICRWKFQGIFVDVMPTAESVLGFSNKWYPEGIKHGQKIKLPDGHTISNFSAPYLIASKIEALMGRSKGDYLISPDLEDIGALLDGCKDIKDQILKAPASVKTYLKENFAKLLANNSLTETLEMHIESAHPGASGRGLKTLALLREITKAL